MQKRNSSSVNRLIVVAEKQTVYKKFPIPLINRLEKHFLDINTMLSDAQQKLVKELEEWARKFVDQSVPTHGRSVNLLIKTVLCRYM